MKATSPDLEVPPPRTLLVFAHPDDETIALGARLARFGRSQMVHVTDGAPRNEQDSRDHGFASLSDYRQARAQELAAALAVAGVPHLPRACFDVPDQEAGLRLPEITRRVLALLEQARFEAVLTHPYEGGHPDHDACAFAVHHAIDIVKERERAVPVLIESAFYHAGPHGIATGTFLPASGGTEEIEYFLSPEEQARKRQMLACFASQQQTLSYFSVTHQRYRIAPRYDFTLPPRSRQVFHDAFPWGMGSQRFCVLAQQAEQELSAKLVRA